MWPLCHGRRDGFRPSPDEGAGRGNDGDALTLTLSLGESGLFGPPRISIKYGASSSDGVGLRLRWGFG